MQFKNLIQGHKSQAVEKFLKGSNNEVCVKSGRNQSTEENLT